MNPWQALRIQLTVFFPSELHQQFLPSSSLPAVHSYPTVVPAQLFSWGRVRPMSCSWLKIALQKKKLIFTQKSSLTVLPQGPANRELLNIHWCHRGMWMCARGQLRMMSVRMGQYLTVLSSPGSPKFQSNVFRVWISGRLQFTKYIRKHQVLDFCLSGGSTNEHPASADPVLSPDGP